MVWRGTATSAIDLTPPTATDSQGYATDGVRQGGVASFNQVWHAGIWSGSAQSFIDLNIGPNSESWLFGMAPGQQVGYSHTLGSSQHAAIWSGTAASFIDLRPSVSIGNSVLYATTGAVQVGDCEVFGGVFSHAGIWFGSAASFIDLHLFLPPGFSSSRATSVIQMPDGTITVGGWAGTSASPYYQHAFMWTYAPAPGGMGLFAAAAVLATCRRRSTS